MFKEISYTSIIMSFTSFATEIIYRAKLSEEDSNALYDVQSNLVIAAAIVQTLVSVYILRTLHKLTAIRMRIINVIADALILTAIALRGKYTFFLPLESVKYSLYNITSFFLCVQTFTFFLFWFYRGPYQEQDAYSLPPPRRNNNNSSASVHRYDEEIDYTLPSYSEVPAPPAYTKTVVPEDNNEPIELNDVSSHHQVETTVEENNTSTTEHTIVNMSNTPLDDNNDHPEAGSTQTPEYSTVITTTSSSSEPNNTHHIENSVPDHVIPTSTDRVNNNDSQDTR